MTMIQDELRLNLTAQAGNFSRTMETSLTQAQKLQGYLGGLTFGLGFGQLIYQAREFTDLSLRFERMSTGFRTLSKSLGVAADVMTADVQKITQAQISMIDTTQSLNKAMTLIPASAREMEQLTTIAYGASFALGENVKNIFDDILTGLGRASPKILDNLGIVINSTEAYQLYSEEIGKNYKQLTAEEKQLALLNFVLEKNVERFSLLAAVAKPDPFQQMSAAFKDLQVVIGGELAPSISSFVKELTFVIRSDMAGWAMRVAKAMSFILKAVVAFAGFKIFNVLLLKVKALRASFVELQKVSSIQFFEKFDRIRVVAHNLSLYQKALQGSAIHSNLLTKNLNLQGASWGVVSAKMEKSIKALSDADAKWIVRNNLKITGLRNLTGEQARAIIHTNLLTGATQFSAAGFWAAARAGTGFSYALGLISTGIKAVWRALGPLVLLLIAVQAATYAWNAITKKSKEALDNARRSLDEVREKISNYVQVTKAATVGLADLVVEFDNFDEAAKLSIKNADKLKQSLEEYFVTVGDTKQGLVELTKTSDTTAEVTVKLLGSFRNISSQKELLISTYGGIEKALSSLSATTLKFAKINATQAYQTAFSALLTFPANKVKPKIPINLDDLEASSAAFEDVFDKLQKFTFPVDFVKTVDGVFKQFTFYPTVLKRLFLGLERGTITVEELSAAMSDLKEFLAINNFWLNEAGSDFQALGDAALAARLNLISSTQAQDEFVESLILARTEADELGKKLDDLRDKWGESIAVFGRRYRGNAFEEIKDALLEAGDAARDYLDDITEITDADYLTQWRAFVQEFLEGTGDADLFDLIPKNIRSNEQLIEFFDDLEESTKEAAEAIEDILEEHNKAWANMTTTVYESIVLLDQGIISASEAASGLTGSLVTQLSAIATTGEILTEMGLFAHSTAQAFQFLKDNIPVDIFVSVPNSERGKLPLVNYLEYVLEFSDTYSTAVDKISFISGNLTRILSDSGVWTLPETSDISDAVFNSISNLSTTVVDLLEKAPTEEAFEELKRLIPEHLKSLSDVVAVARDVYTTSDEVIAALNLITESIVSGTAESRQAYIDFLNDIAERNKGLEALFSDVDISEGMKTLRLDIQKGLGELLETPGVIDSSNIDNITRSYKLLLTYLTDIRTDFSESTNAVELFLWTVETGSANAFATFINWIEAALEKLGLLKDVSEGLDFADLGTGIGDAISDALESGEVRDLFAGLTQNIGDFFVKDIGDSIAGAIEGDKVFGASIGKDGAELLGGVSASLISFGVSALASLFDSGADRVDPTAPLEVFVVNPIELKDPKPSYALLSQSSSYARDFRIETIGGRYIN